MYAHSLRLFSSSSMEGIMQNLKADGTEFAKKQAEVQYVLDLTHIL